ncbi:fumarate/nitrate reduction transcriptional regulator Fnr [Pseudoduganella namucuonensis]|uniref:CRP/FNR family transcriptional regulator, anaerobic regulatory protein n=1 Tax=Pseudoduganella namucuonensis TaxID=1035707 RepID=A0A1I7KP28_9BURK|nr:fumarate/nitrate reduction transcriptional regulator Fnr [Pseudoduganella namucuonensis]SFU99116.1 CRP/FNR family transcriptional regulator, anaerobic regulatory protein [Pseudoduganella namucuonensis]
MHPTIPIAVVNPQRPGARAEVRCGLCSFNKLCLPQGLDEHDMGRLDQIIVRRRRVLRDESLYAMGQSFHSLYAVRLGHFKTAQVNRRGEQQITGFHMAGDLLGMEAIGSGQHSCAAVALEDSEVCEIPFARLQELVLQVPPLMQHFHRTMAREIQREQSVMLFLGNMRAEQRLALFLLSMGARYAARGYSPASFQLRMSREDIGGYLGLTIESVSRLLARFRKQGWISLDKREVSLLDLAGLERLSLGVAGEAEDGGVGGGEAGNQPDYAAPRAA